jgi:folate-binding protein YgfZ
MGRLLFRGADVLDLLGRLSTNRLDDLAVGRGVTTVLSNPKGRIVDWLAVLHTAVKDTVLVVTSAERREAVAEWIDMYTFDEDAAMEDVTAATAMLGVIGPAAGDVLGLVIGVDVSGLPLHGSLPATWRGHGLTVARTDPGGQHGYDVVVPASGAVALWDAVLAAGASHGIAPMGADAFEALRVQAGVPRWGRELSEQRNPLEAGLEGDISWDKGCYIGQEVVARLHTYHKVQRYLVSLALDAAATPGASLVADGRAVGVLSSVATSPENGETVALGYLRTPFVEVGRVVGIGLEGGGTGEATVVRTPELPSGPVPSVLLDDEDDEDAEPD